MPEELPAETPDAIAQWGSDFEAVSAWFEATPNWWIALLVALGVYAFLVLLRTGVLAGLGMIAARSEQAWPSLLKDVLSRSAPLVFTALALYAGTRIVALPPALDRLVGSLALIAIVVQAAVWASHTVFALVAREAERQAARGSGDATLQNAISLIHFGVRVVVWSVALLMILSNLGVDVTALVAGLGIGGIAIGLAAQGIISDLFASLSIVLDKPFVAGDFIIFGEFMGTVERIGLKTTRIRALSGEQIVVANADLLATRIRNYKRMQERRAVFQIGVTYQTPADKLEGIPAVIEEIVERQEKTRFDRCRFQSFGDFALVFETVYYVLDADYAVYAAIQEQINLEIYRTFEERGIEFAYPTQTVFLERAGTSGSPEASTP